MPKVTIGLILVKMSEPFLDEKGQTAIVNLNFMVTLPTLEKLFPYNRTLEFD